MSVAERLKNILLALVFGSFSAFIMVGVFVVGGSDAIIRTGRSCGFSRTQAEDFANVFAAIGVCVAGLVTVLWIVAVLRARGADDVKFNLGAMMTAGWVVLTLVVVGLAILAGLACETGSLFS